LFYSTEEQKVLKVKYLIGLCLLCYY